MRSFRENQFAERLSRRGHNVKVITSDQSYIWKHNRAGVKPTDPVAEEASYRALSNLSIIRRSPWFRMGDLVMLPLSRLDFRDADIVHVLDFRQGVTAVAARLARSLKKPVIYDHEQRGDRIGSPLHSFDNIARRLLIKYGGRTPSLVRHTVLSNRLFFEKIVPGYNGKFALTPLGVDERIFFKDEGLRSSARASLATTPDQRMFLLTGKIDHDKRPLDLARAMRRTGTPLYVAGKISETVEQEMGQYDGLRILGVKSQRELNALYNAADCAIFTTFTLSYWEALAAGSNVIVPSTRFSQLVLQGAPGVVLFGEPSMFAVEEERYKCDIVLDEKLVVAIEKAKLLERSDSDRAWLGWDEKIDVLERQYQDAINSESHAL